MTTSMRPMNILVTGAGGFIGGHLAQQLAQKGHCVVALYRTMPDYVPTNVQTLISDLADISSHDIQNIFHGEPFALAHLAWHAPREPSFAVAAQHLGHMAYLLDLCKNRLNHVICLGTPYEYGKREGCLADDTPPEGPMIPYGWSKAAARRLLKDWSESSGIPCFWMRFPTTYGEGQSRDLLIPYAIKKAAMNEEALFSDGLQERDFLHIDDVVNAVILALQNPVIGFHSANFGPGNPIQIKALIGLIASLFDAPPLFSFNALPRRNDEPTVRYLETDKGKAMLGWTQQVGLEEGLRRVKTWILASQKEKTAAKYVMGGINKQEVRS